MFCLGIDLRRAGSVVPWVSCPLSPGSVVCCPLGQLSVVPQARSSTGPFFLRSSVLSRPSSLSICLSACLSISLSLCPFLCVFVSLSVSVSVSLSVCLSLSPSVFLLYLPIFSLKAPSPVLSFVSVVFDCLYILMTVCRD